MDLILAATALPNVRELIHLVVLLVIVGVCLYLLNTIPMDGTVKVIIRVVVILFAVLFLLSYLGLY